MLKYVVAFFLGAMLFSALAPAQVKSFTPTEAKSQKAAAEHEASLTSEDPHEKLQQELVNRVVAERQMQLVQDTEKLLALAAELKLNVAKTNNNVLSMDVIKKAQEIQKLAKSVQDKMKNPY